MNYVRLTQGKGNKVFLIPETQDPYSIVGKNQDKSWFFSPVYYSETHKKAFNKNKSIAGIRDVTTNNLWWDIDSKDLNDSRDSTIQLCEKLLTCGFKEHHFKITATSNKGFHVLIKIDKSLNIDQVKNICMNLGEGINGVDSKVYLPTQLLRLPNTTHEKTKLFALPMTYTELKSTTIDEIKELSKLPRQKTPNFHSAILKDDIYNLKNKHIESESSNKQTEEVDLGDMGFDLTEMNFANKPAFIKSNALYALHQGFFRGSETSDCPERKIAFLTLAANFKALGFDKEDNYRLLKSCRDRQAQRTGEDKFTDGELYNDVLASVYSPAWKGGVNKEWLDEYRKKYGIVDGSGEAFEEIVTTLEDGFGKFTQYINEIDKNTIKTGIKSIDDNVMLLTGRIMGIAAPPSCGKTAIAFQMLNNMSKAGVNSIYCPYDSSSSNLFLTLLMRHTGLSVDELVEKLKDRDFQNKAKEILKKNYPSTRFVWKTSQTCEEIRETIKKTEQRTGEPVKVVFVDYLELVSVDTSDETTQTKKAILGLQEIAQEENCLVVILLQPSKMGTDITKPFTTYNQVKGSSAINQSVSVLLSLCRPGHNPQDSDNDIFMNVTCLKNKLGSLFSVDLRWEGRRMSVRELEEVERIQLANIRSAQDGQNNSNGGF